MAKSKSVQFERQTHQTIFEAQTIQNLRINQTTFWSHQVQQTGKQNLMITFLVNFLEKLTLQTLFLFMVKVLLMATLESKALLQALILAIINLSVR